MPAQYCTFRLDGHLFGIPVETVQEVLQQQPMASVPLAPPEVAGLLNLRGQIVVTLDLRIRLGLPVRPDGQQTVGVVVCTHEGTVNLVVDQIGDVLEPADDRFEPVPQTVPASVRSVVDRVCTLESELLLVLDTDRAVTTTVGAGAS
jgi:purine-binding chemotaxis protein CheW